MSARLIGELANWLLSPAAADVTPHERLVLFVIAERSHERTRLMLRHRGDELQLVDRIAATTGLAREGALKKAFQKLERRGLEVRIPVKIGKNGRPVFTHEGHSMRFRLPEFPASVTIPERLDGPVDDASEPVDNPVDDGPDETADDDERRDETSHHSARGETNRPASGDERRDETSRPYPSNYTSNPSTSSYPSHSTSSVAEVSETSRASAPDDSNRDRQQSRRRFPFDQVSATALILRLPPDVQAAVTEQAEKELGPGAPIAALRIRAAEIAAKGIPA